MAAATPRNKRAVRPRTNVTDSQHFSMPQYQVTSNPVSVLWTLAMVSSIWKKCPIFRPIFYRCNTNHPAHLICILCGPTFQLAPARHITDLQERRLMSAHPECFLHYKAGDVTACAPCYKSPLISFFLDCIPLLLLWNNVSQTDRILFYSRSFSTSS